MEAFKAADPPGRCQQQAVFQETTKAWPPSCEDGPGAFPRSLLRPGEPSDAFATCEGPLRMEVGEAGAGARHRREAGSWNLQETAEIEPRVVFPRDSRVTVRSWVVCCGYYAQALPLVKSPSSSLRVGFPYASRGGGSALCPERSQAPLRLTS